MKRREGKGRIDNIEQDQERGAYTFNTSLSVTKKLCERSRGKGSEGTHYI